MLVVHNMQPSNLIGLAGIVADVRKVITLDDPVGAEIDSRVLENGLRLSRRRVPIGVIGVIYEARPNVTIDIASLTEAAQSLGAGWARILAAVILPNVFVSVLSGAFLTFAIVIGEYVFAALLNVNSFGPYMVWMGGNRAYEPSALAVVAFAITWACMGLIQLATRLARHTRAKS